MLSQTCKYAIRSIIYIAKNSDKTKKVGLKKISEELNIPSPFLGKILQTLTKKKILLSTKGPNGGFSLYKDAKKISLLDIMEIIDGLDYFNTCLIGLKSCSDKTGYCSTHKKYNPIRKQIYKLFKTETIYNLLNEIDNSNGKINI